MADYIDNKAIGHYFRAISNRYSGSVRFLGSRYEYQVVRGIPDVAVMLEIVDVENGVFLVQVNNELFENGRGFIHDSR